MNQFRQGIKKEDNFSNSDGLNKVLRDWEDWKHNYGFWGSSQSSCCSILQFKSETEIFPKCHLSKKQDTYNIYNPNMLRDFKEGNDHNHPTVLLF